MDAEGALHVADAGGRNLPDPRVGKGGGAKQRGLDAAGGRQADERLLEVADNVWSGFPPGASALEAALGWGASSFVDALSGMPLCLTGRLHS